MWKPVESAKLRFWARVISISPSPAIWADMKQSCSPSGAEGSVEATGQHTGLEAGDAEEGHLAEGDALDGEDFLGVDGTVGVEGILAEVVEGLEVFEADDGEGGAGEAVLAGVESGLGFAGGGAGAGGFLRVAAVGGDLLVGSHGGCLSEEREVLLNSRRSTATSGRGDAGRGKIGRASGRE